MAQVTEGFLCPICMADLGDVIQLQLHFDERHSKEDPAFVQNLKDLFGKAKQKIKKGFDEGSSFLGNEAAPDINSLALANNLHILNETQQTVKLYGTEYSSNVHPVSGIQNTYLEDAGADNIIPMTNHFEFYRTERAKRADMLAMDTNKLIIRLEKLLASLPNDPVKRRSHEQAIVAWLPEDSVKLCPNCARSFNLTRRKHHCRLCGSIMCADCSDYVHFDLAKRLINPATISKYENNENQGVDKGITNGSKKATSSAVERLKLNPSYDNLAKNLADLTGIAESQQQFRTCTYCAENLQKRDARVTLTTENQSPVLQRYYEKLRQLMADGTKMSRDYREIAKKLNAGEPATSLTIEEAKRLRIRLLKAAENVDAVSKAIVTLDEDDSSKNLRSRIRNASINFVKETLVGLPGIPTEDEHRKLQEDRKKEAAKKIQQEQKAAATAKLKYEQEIAKRSAKLSAANTNSSYGGNTKHKLSPQTNRKSQKTKVQTVKYGNGFVSSTSRAKHIDSEDPIVLQIGNLREFITQARAAGKHDDAKLLEDNLRDLQQEYQRQRQLLEENYNDFKDVFGKKEDVEEILQDTTSDNSPNEDDFDQNNPFFVGPEDEMNEIEKALGPEQIGVLLDEGQLTNNSDDTNPFKDTVDDEAIVDGSVDFDQYDQSGRNPFF